MAQPEPRSPKGNRPPNGANGDPNFNWRGLILFAIAIMLIGGAFIFNKNGPMSAEEVSFPQFKAKLESGEIDKEKGIDLINEQSMGTHFLRATLKGGEGSTAIKQVRTQVDLQYMPYLQWMLEEQHKIAVTPRTDSNFLASALLGFMPIALFLLILYFFFRQQIRMAGKGALNFGKSKARMMARD